MFPMHGGFMGKRKGDVGLPFIFTVTVGSGQSFQLPTFSAGTYDALIDWGDTTSNTLTVWNAAGRTHTYTTGGTYEIRISGVFTGWIVNNYADRLKITEVKQWGILKLSTNQNQFFGCSNLTITATDILDTSNATSFGQFFRGCSSLTDVPNIGLWDVSNVLSIAAFAQSATNFIADVSGWDTSAMTLMWSAFNGCVNFNADISNWNTSNVTEFQVCFLGCTSFNSDISQWDTTKALNMSQMLRACPSFNRSLGDWNIETVTNASNLLFQSTLSTINYDDILIKWAAQSPNALSVHFGSSKYTNSGAALAARNTLITTYGWTITDGGPA